MTFKNELLVPVQAISHTGCSQCYQTVITQIRKYSKWHKLLQYVNISKQSTCPEENVSVNEDF